MLCKELVSHVGMLDQPLLHLDLQPEAVDTEGDQGQQEPLDVVAEQLTAGAVEHQLMAVNIGVLRDPAFLNADSPGCAEAKSEANDQTLQDVDADQAQKSALELRYLFGCRELIHRNTSLYFLG